MSGQASMSPARTGGIRRGCAARGWRLRPRFVIASHTVEAASTPGIVWINVGTGTGSGIANFRAPDSGVRGSCESVVQRQSELFAHVLACWDGPAELAEPKGRELEVTICLPESFKPDDAAAACLVQYLLEDGELPPAAPALAAYMAWGRRSAEPHFRTPGPDRQAPEVRRLVEELAAEDEAARGATIPLSLALVSRHWKRMSGEGKRNPAAALVSLVALTRTAIDAMAEEPPTNAKDVDAVLARRGWGQSPGDAVREDVRSAMQAVLAFDSTITVTSCRARLNHDDPAGAADEVEALIGTCPCKADTAITGLLRLVYSAGFRSNEDGTRPSVVVLHGPAGDHGSWFDISLAVAEAGTRRGSLKGLGLALEALEQQRRSAAGDSRRALHGRFRDIPGIADPWYDGRDHDFGLVGGPRDGEQSVLSIADVRFVLATAYWQAAATRVRCFGVQVVNEGRAIPLRGADRGGIYRERQREGVIDGAEETWRYATGTGAAIPQAVRRLRHLEVAPAAPGLPIRLEPAILGPDPRHGDMGIVVIDLARPPFLPDDRTPSVGQCLPASARDRWRSEVCGPGSRTVILDANREADVGPRGVIVWRGPECTPEADGGWEIARVVMDVLAYRSDLGALIAAASGAKADDSRTSASQLAAFVEIVRSYHPERTTTDLRRVCETLEESLSVPTVIERLERFLQFSDERARIAHERMMQVVLLALAFPALLQTPADLLQAWSAWHQEEGRVPGTIAFFEGDAGWWILKAASLLLLAFFVLYLLLYNLAPRVRVAWSRLRHERWTPRR